MKKYNIINNALGWLTFGIAAFTYLSTLEPTASFWDCPEFIAQGFKLEIGHPPGNPVFILVARIATMFAGGDVALVSKCVNAMSGLLSAATILLLFWSITALVKRLIVDDGNEERMTAGQYLAVMGSGLCGALAYTWSDTFWFSAVEAEVYAFSSFCTALVFWLILKWESRYGTRTADRYLILIAFVFGISLGVHLLNLLAIPAIALIMYYRSVDDDATVKGSLLTLLASFGVIVLILYGLEPGFVKLAGHFEVFFVNTVGMSFNSGVVIYALVLMASLAWTLYQLYNGKNDKVKYASFLVSLFLCGILFSSGSVAVNMVWLLVFAALAVALFTKKLSISSRALSIVTLCVMMIFVGFSSYALVLIRSNANTPLDENSPNSPFALTGYLSRDQYGKSPLIYGNTVNSEYVHYADGGTVETEGAEQYTREVKTSADQKDAYYDLGPSKDGVMTPELNMLFPRIHSASHAQQYADLLGDYGEMVDGTTFVSEDGDVLRTETFVKPTMADNLSFFFSYQLNYMYWRYFLWNFAGRQNDLQGSGPGDMLHGNWITGFSVLDDARLGDTSMMPDELTDGNKGNNKFYMLPLILGLIGLFWQAFKGRRGINQFWVVFFLFFMTGIAIVMYLNQTPSQPRERDYAYAGSFYAYAIWIGMGVAAIYRFITTKMKEEKGLVGGVVAAAIGVAVPLQMVGQTWDDHDRSGRYCARDFGMNYLAGIEKDGIIFCNGDNDTFPLWYAQEVEGYRTDVRAVNLSYLATDWYIAQMQRAAYDSKPLPMLAGDTTYAYNKRQAIYFPPTSKEEAAKIKPVSAEQALSDFYDDDKYIDPEYGVAMLKNTLVTIDAKPDEAVKRGIVPASETDSLESTIVLDLTQGGRKPGMNASELCSFDLITTSIRNGWTRPCYFAMTIPDSYYLGLTPYLRNVGMAYQVTPARAADDNAESVHSNTDRMYDVVTKQFRWGGIDKAKPGSLYIDETVARMINSTRTALVQLAHDLIDEGEKAEKTGRSPEDGKTAEEYAKDRYAKAQTVLDLMMTKLPVESCAFSYMIGGETGRAYYRLAETTGDAALKKKAIAIYDHELNRYAQYVRYYAYLESIGEHDRRNLPLEERVLIQILGNYYDVNPDGIETYYNKFLKMGFGKDRIAEYREYIRQLNMTEEEYMEQQKEQMRARAKADSMRAAAEQQAPASAEQQAPAPSAMPGLLY